MPEVRVCVEEMKPTVISTFAGCGGSSLGYKLAGFHELLAVEWEQNAVDTFRLNFPDVPVFHGDIAKLSVDECLRLAGGIKSGELDVFDGSPPCQGFSTAGKRKFDDPRNSLFKEFARLLEGLQPKVFVMENVTGMVKGPMKQAYLQIVKTLRECGYQVKGEVMNAMYYNVPQSRERVIIIGVRNDLGVLPSHPKPQTKPMSVREALVGCDDDSGAPFPDWLKRAAKEMDAGNFNHQHVMKAFLRHKGTPGSSASFKLLAWDRHCCTIAKSWIAAAGIGHPDRERYLSAGELKRLASFPDQYKFAGNFEKITERIGNSVPPNLMRAIAEHIKREILENP
jgi:DNA (cytosine-5)-methyltransferase 1